MKIIVERLTARAASPTPASCESPFTDLDPIGVSGVLSDADASNIVDSKRPERMRRRSGVRIVARTDAVLRRARPSELTLDLEAAS